MHLNQLIILNCESRKELDNIQHPAAFVLPGCDRGTHVTIQSLNVPAGQFLFCYPWHCWGLHPGGAAGYMRAASSPQVRGSIAKRVPYNPAQ